LIPFFSSYVDPLATTYVSEVLNSGMLSEGKMVEKFEREFEKTFDLKTNSVVAVNSGTSALHLAIETLGVVGEILLPANTFIATGLAILYAGCTPVFCDILSDGTIDPDDVRRKITTSTVAVIGVNWAGKECKVEKLERICAQNGLLLIIDAAQSLGCRVGGDITCFSFQATKHLTTGDGGALVCKDDDDYDTAKELRWFGISKKTRAGVLGEREYNLQRVGFKYHMNDYSAALGLANLINVNERLIHHKLLAHTYFQHLYAAVPLHVDGSFWAYPILVDDVTRFSEFCRSRGVPCSIIHRGIDHNEIFGGTNYSLVYQRHWESRVTHLPIHVNMSIEDVLWICGEVNQYV
jgi:perosamine synthetase